MTSPRNYRDFLDDIVGASRSIVAEASFGRRLGADKVTDPKHVSTSYVERANLKMRMSMRRFTRLTNAFSKKLAHGALYALWYNFVRAHKTLPMSPAMAAGIESQLWSMEDVVRLIEKREDLRSGALLVG